MLYTMIDIVFPQNNEQKFIDMAKKLGYDSLCFVYSLKDFNIKKIKSDLKIKYAILAPDKKSRKPQKTKLVFFECKENIRKVIESNKDIIVFGFEQDDKKDFIHQRRSGLNHIICNLATKNNVKIGLSFSSLLKTNEKKRNLLIGRTNTNIKLCRKYKTKMIIGSFASDPFEMRSYKDLVAFFSTIGMHPSEIKSI